MRKKRVVMIIDYEIDGGFLGETAKFNSLQAQIEKITDADKDVVYWDMDMKERRGNSRPKLSEWKFKKS